MTKRENALRQFVDKYGEKLSGKEVFEDRGKGITDSER